MADLFDQLPPATPDRQTPAEGRPLADRLLRRVAVPVLLVDARGDLLYINEPAEQIFGRRFDEIDALPFAERGAILPDQMAD